VSWPGDKFSPPRGREGRKSHLESCQRVSLFLIMVLREVWGEFIKRLTVNLSAPGNAEQQKAV